MINIETLEQALDDNVIRPETWKPAVGDKLFGRLLKYEKAQGAYGECWIAVLKEIRRNAKTGAEELTGNVFSVWLSHRVLFNEFQKQRPKPGELLAIKRLPDHEHKYKMYRLIVARDEKDAPAPDWEAEPKAAGDSGPDEDVGF